MAGWERERRACDRGRGRPGSLFSLRPISMTTFQTIDENHCFALRRSDGGVLEFQGRRLAQSEGSHITAAGYERWHNLRLYATDDDLLVPVIEFHTNCPMEVSATIADFVDDIGEVEKFLYVYEPFEFVNNKTIRESTREDRAKFVNALYADYHLQVNGVLLASREYAETHPRVADEDNSRENVIRNRLSSLFKFLGLK